MKAWPGLLLTLLLVETAWSQILPPCASDEIYNSTANTCSCNLTMYNSTVPPPIPTIQCLPGQIKLTLSKCQLEKSRYSSDGLHLSDPGCLGVRELDGTSAIVLVTDTTTGACGNNQTINGSHVTYYNVLTIPPLVLPSGILVRSYANIHFTCSYPLILHTALTNVITAVLGSTDILLPGGIGSVTVIMAVYTKPDFTNPYTESSPDLNVEDPLYVSVQIPALEASLFSVRVLRLYAKGSNTSADAVSYDLMSGGCPTAELGSLVTVDTNGETNEARFVVGVFKISSSDSVYLFAEAQICDGVCIRDCTGAS